jgi:alkanesulfonate monooxygenase SsuD/methylene tetrahydromethanopterin reductase-like flavin-dependent oxidoreductase (luciferase family)
MPYGTPEQVLEKVRRIHRHIGNAGLLATFSFGGMPYDVAERSLRLFSKEVLPELKKFEVGVPAFAESA